MWDNVNILLSEYLDENCSMFNLNYLISINNDTKLLFMFLLR